MVTEGSLPFSQQPATYSYPEKVQSNPRPKILFLETSPLCLQLQNACAVGNFEVI